MRRLFQHCRREEAIYLNIVNFSTATVFLYYYSQNNNMQDKPYESKKAISKENYS